MAGTQRGVTRRGFGRGLGLTALTFAGLSFAAGATAALLPPRAVSLDAISPASAYQSRGSFTLVGSAVSVAQERVALWRKTPGSTVWERVATATSDTEPDSWAWADAVPAIPGQYQFAATLDGLAPGAAGAISSTVQSLDVRASSIVLDAMKSTYSKGRPVPIRGHVVPGEPGRFVQVRYKVGSTGVWMTSTTQLVTDSTGAYVGSLPEVRNATKRVWVYTQVREGSVWRTSATKSFTLN